MELQVILTSYRIFTGLSMLSLTISGVDESGRFTTPIREIVTKMVHTIRKGIWITPIVNGDPIFLKS